MKSLCVDAYTFGTVAIASTLLVGTLRAELEWRGMIERDNTPTFALTNSENGNSKWVPLGGTFESYSVASYDGRRQVLVLTKEGVRVELTLA